MDKYDFDDFLTRMAKLDYHEILRQADEECGRAERSRDGGAHAARIKSFIWFMNNFKVPGSHPDDLSSYKPVVVALVDKGQVKPEVLAVFGK